MTETSEDQTRELSPAQKVQLIEDLLTGGGAKDFEELGRRLKYFCPFEAIGMVRQEIRHAHFLCFLLDPNQSHPFGDIFIKTLLLEIVSQASADAVPFSALDMHFMSANSAVVYRERWNIDIVIEIPASAFEHLDKGLVIAIELKIDAAESEHQLEKYRDRIVEEYAREQWNYCFAFVTPKATEPSTQNKAFWTPVSLLEILDRFDATLQPLPFSGRAVDLYRDYKLMTGRHLLEDDELAKIAKRVWSKHRKALEVLYDFWPDLQAEIIEWIRENPTYVADTVRHHTDFNIQADTHSPRILRYAVQDWLDISHFCDGDRNWVESGAILVMEIGDWGDGRLRASLVLGPAEQDVRERIYEKVLERVDAGCLKIGRRTATPKNKWKHLSSTDIQQRHAYETAEEDETPAEELGKKAVEEFARFLAQNLSEYDTIVRSVLEE